MMIISSTEDWAERVRLALASGNLVVFPTDTVYGVGGDPTIQSALDLLYRLKGNRENKPYPILVSSKELALTIGNFSSVALRLAEKYWPGPLTLVVPLKDKRLKAATFGSDYVGLRIPADRVAMRVAELSPSGLLIGTSANKSGGNPPRLVDEVDSSIYPYVSVIVDGGKRDGMPSTVLQVEDSHLKLIRLGAISMQELQNV